MTPQRLVARRGKRYTVLTVYLYAVEADAILSAVSKRVFKSVLYLRHTSIVSYRTAGD